MGRYPPGFRFRPTDEELVNYYLRRKVGNLKVDDHVIAEVDLYQCEPWDVSEKSFLPDDNEWYFFSPRENKYPKGGRTNRATDKGYWKATGKDRSIPSRTGAQAGLKKTLVFYLGRAPRGARTDWIMHEYRLDRADGRPGLPGQESFVLCRVFNKKGDPTDAAPAVGNASECELPLAGEVCGPDLMEEPLTDALMEEGYGVEADSPVGFVTLDAMGPVVAPAGPLGAVPQCLPQPLLVKEEERADAEAMAGGFGTGDATSFGKDSVFGPADALSYASTQILWGTGTDFSSSPSMDDTSGDNDGTEAGSTGCEGIEGDIHPPPLEDITWQDLQDYRLQNDCMAGAQGENMTPSPFGGTPADGDSRDATSLWCTLELVTSGSEEAGLLKAEAGGQQVVDSALLWSDLVGDNPLDEVFGDSSLGLVPDEVRGGIDGGAAGAALEALLGEPDEDPNSWLSFEEEKSGVSGDFVILPGEASGGHQSRESSIDEAALPVYPVSDDLFSTVQRAEWEFAVPDSDYRPVLGPIDGAVGWGKDALIFTPGSAPLSAVGPPLSGFAGSVHETPGVMVPPSGAPSLSSPSGSSIRIRPRPSGPVASAERGGHPDPALRRIRMAVRPQKQVSCPSSLRSSFGPAGNLGKAGPAPVPSGKAASPSSQQLQEHSSSIVGEVGTGWAQPPWQPRTTKNSTLSTPSAAQTRLGVSHSRRGVRQLELVAEGGSGGLPLGGEMAAAQGASRVVFARGTGLPLPEGAKGAALSPLGTAARQHLKRSIAEAVATTSSTSSCVISRVELDSTARLSAAKVHSQQAPPAIDPPQWKGFSILARPAAPLVGEEEEMAAGTPPALNQGEERVGPTWHAGTGPHSFVHMLIKRGDNIGNSCCEDTCQGGGEVCDEDSQEDRCGVACTLEASSSGCARSRPLLRKAVRRTVPCAAQSNISDSVAGTGKAEPAGKAPPSSSSLLGWLDYFGGPTLSANAAEETPANVSTSVERHSLSPLLITGSDDSKEAERQPLIEPHCMTEGAAVDFGAGALYKKRPPRTSGGRRGERAWQPFRYVLILQAYGRKLWLRASKWAEAAATGMLLAAGVVSLVRLAVDVVT